MIFISKERNTGKGVFCPKLEVFPTMVYNHFGTDYLISKNQYAKSIRDNYRHFEVITTKDTETTVEFIKITARARNLKGCFMIIFKDDKGMLKFKDMVIIGKDGLFYDRLFQKLKKDIKGVHSISNSPKDLKRKIGLSRERAVKFKCYIMGIKG